MEGRPWSICRQSAGAPLATAGSMSIRAVLDRVFSAVDASGPRPVLAIGNGDPTASACFRPPLEAEETVVEALRSRKHKVLLKSTYHGIFLISFHQMIFTSPLDAAKLLTS